jgi:hypothetical protein
MKTNLLKMAIGAFFSLAMLSAANVNAQITAYENFEYPLNSDYVGLSGSGSGWAGPWDHAKEGTVDAYPGRVRFAKAIAGNLEGSIGLTGTLGGQWVDNYRDLATPFVNEPGSSVWIGFTYINGKPGKGYGTAYFWGGNETLYIGALPGDVAGIGNCYQDAACLGPIADAPSLSGILTANKHYYLLKVTSVTAGDIFKIDLWIDYNGATAPVADFDLEPTYEASGYRKAAGGIDLIRLSTEIEPSEATTLYSKYDAIRFSSTFFCKSDLTLTGNCTLPLDLVSLNAKSTATGNLVTWDFTSNDGVASISVSRKGDNGEFTVIKPGLPKDAKSFVDTNPLPGTNYYLLSSTDNDGTVKEYTNFIKSVKGFEVEPTFFPNPSTGGVVNVVAGNGAVKSVSIFDLTGKKVASKAGAGAVSTSSLAKGVYIIEITSDKSTTRNKLVVE